MCDLPESNSSGCNSIQYLCHIMVYEQCKGFLNTPPLWKNEQFSVLQFDFPKIEFEDFSPQKIPTNIRLGHQMEHVFKQLIDYSSLYEVLVYNLPVRNGKITIGEIDFILKETETQKLIHVELTYKFYIIDPSISEPIHRLMGPNRRDMFYTKMEKIKNNQFGLLHSPNGIIALQEKGIDHKEIAHEVCYKAQLFSPYNSEVTHIRPLDKDCIVGFWLRFDDFNSKEFQGYKYYIPSKSEWVVQPYEEVLWQSHFEILMAINMRMLKENSPMIWMKKSATEFEKFFVVWW